jgi:hypothetical protein
MNVDITHYVTPDYDLFAGMPHPRPTMLPHKMGAHFHCKGFVHWGGDSSVAAHYVTAAYDQLFWNYYVTGNRRALDMGSDGYRVGGSEGTLKAAVQPNTLYYLAAGTLKSATRITPVGYPLILARSIKKTGIG